MLRRVFLAPLLLSTLAVCGEFELADPPDRVTFDFETGGLQGWRGVEGQFGKLVCEPRDVRNSQGKFLLTTLQAEKERDKSDRMTGVLESPVFVLKAPRMSLRVGGGKHRETYVALCTLDGKEHLHARGKDSVVMQEIAWDAPQLVGKKVFLRIVDKHEGGWGHVTFDDFQAEGTIDKEATAAWFAGAEQHRRDAERQKQVEAVRQTLEPLRLAIADLVDDFGPKYPKGKDFAGRLDALGKRFDEAQPQDMGKLASEMEVLQHEALVANPLVSGHPILFVSRRQYRPDHHNTETMFQTGEICTGSFTGGGALKTIDFATGGAVKTLLDVPKGVARDLDVSFDGQRILFSLRHDIKDDYHLYEIHADGSGLKQLTFGPGVSDFDPLYLPDGRIALTSTREPKYCMCNRHIMGNLFRMDADGANLHQIGHSTLHEGHGSLTPDGRILYDRWEYVDRNFGDAQGLWTSNPDGTNHAVFWGNNTPSPGAVLDARILPGAPERFLATFSSCHDRPWGAIALVDRRIGIDGKPPVVRTWPATAMAMVMQGGYDRFAACSPKYEDPYPLSDKYFLASRQVEGEQMGIVLLDVFGNELLLHTESPGCFDPMPLAPRQRPRGVPDRTDLARQEGHFYIYDVYTGTGMDKVPRGTVKAVRVVESPEKRYWTPSAWDGGTGQQAPGMAWNDFNNKRILGTAPVEPDGSAYFTVPADTFVYFQLHDENGMMVQTMRSGTIARPGETTGCVGCHDNRLAATPNDWKAAIGRKPTALKPWYGPRRLFSYTAEVQPVFDKHCVRCHDYGKPGAKKLLLAGDLTLAFNVSYAELRRKNLVSAIGAGPADILPPYAWGSHKSKLVENLRKGHNDVKLDPESFDRIVTWIDINAPYYPSYASSYPGGLYGRSPLDGKQLGDLSKLVGVNLNGRENADQVSLTRPELSPCLARIADKNDARYKEALAILQAGKEMLAKVPREDMPGAKLVGIEADRERKYERLSQAESEARQAIARGEKHRESP